MRTCGVCGEQSQPRARFCWNCGSPLTETLLAGETERRLVTVLFCDMVGFTARSDGADPEDVRKPLTLFHPLVQRVITAYGGTVNQFVGDGVLTLFGFPVAHEDDAERAVRAGLRIQGSILELNEDHPDLHLSARVGIETGEVLVSGVTPTQFGGSVAGDVVNTASRLQSVAPPGGVAVGAGTYAVAESSFTHEALPPVEVKGKAEPLPVWQVTGTRSLVPDEARRRFRTGLIGRDDELATLEVTFRRVVAERSPAFVVLTGEAGVGKTRLLGELAGVADRLPSLVRWRQGRPSRFGEGGAFGAFADVVKAEAGILDSDGREEVAAKLRHAVDQLAGDPSERDRLFRALSPLVGLSDAPEGEDRGWAGDVADEARLEEMYGLWRRFVELMAADDPLVLVLDDMHDATPPFLGLVDHLATRVTGLPFLLVVAGRPELLERRPAWSSGGPVAMQVRPLPDRELVQLVRLLLDDVALPPDTIAEVVERSEGIPLYAEEFAQMLKERTTHDGPAADGTIDVTASLRSLVAARLDGLSNEERSAIQDASVVGRSFWLGALVAVGDRDRDDAQRVIGGLADRELVRRLHTSTVQGEEEFTFWHPLVRDVAYTQLPRFERARRHRSVAGWIEQLAGDRASERAEQLAQHYGQALALARAARDPGASDLVEPAARYSLLAAERESGYDPTRADRLFARALSLLPPGHPDRAWALRGAGVVASALARFDQGESFLQEAIDAYAEAGDELGRADTMVSMSRTLLERGELRRADSLLTEAMSLLETREPSPLLTRAYARSAGHLFLIGRNDECVARARRALELAIEYGMAREEVLARNYLGAARALTGEVSGLDDLRDAVRRGTELGVGAETAIAMNNLANCMRFLIGPRASLEAYDELERFCAERGFATASTWAWSGQMEALFETGDWDRLETIAERSATWEEEHGSSIVGASSSLLLAWVALRRGDIATAERISTAASDRAARWGTTEYEAPATVLRAEIALAERRLEDAARELDAFEQGAGLDRVFTIALLPVVVRLSVALGDVGRAEVLVDAVPSHPDSPRDRLSLETARAVLDEAAERYEAAIERYAALSEDWREYGFVLEEGLTRLGVARCASALGDTRRAAAEADSAEAVFDRLRAPPLVALARAIGTG